MKGGVKGEVKGKEEGSERTDTDQRNNGRIIVH